MFKGITLVSIARENNTFPGHGNSTNLRTSMDVFRPSRTVPKLFNENEVSWGNFGALVGHCPLAVNGNGNLNGTCIYPIAIGAKGLMLASVPLVHFTNKTKVCTFFTYNAIALLISDYSKSTVYIF